MEGKMNEELSKEFDQLIADCDDPTIYGDELSGLVSDLKQTVESVLDNADGIEDERNVYLAYFDAMGIDVIEVTRIGRNFLNGDGEIPYRSDLAGS
jgi:hypothetical protein